MFKFTTRHARQFKNLFGACALASPVTFLTGDHVIQIGFGQISPSASPSRDLGTRLNVMVDRGFDISNIVPDGVTVNMPLFLAGREQMTAAGTEETMSIASVRIHVERAIGRIKIKYHILDGTLPNTLSPYASQIQIAVVCGLLTNFLPPLLEPAKEPLHVLVS